MRRFKLLLPAFCWALPLVATVAVVAAAEGPNPQPEKIALWSDQAPSGDGKFEATTASLTVHLPVPERANGAAVVICPGGGYRGLVVGAEGHGIAGWLNQHGVAGIVLEYRLPTGRSMVPLLDAQRAIRTVRTKAAEWKIDPNRIGIAGFSAGGHLASTAGTHFDEGNPQAKDSIDRVSCRPDFMLLVYPVITMGEKTHLGSRGNLLGKEPTSESIAFFSNEKQVTDRTPPTFLAHPKDDKVVPVEHSRMFYDALKSHNVPAEYLELPEGGHGLNGYKGPMWDAWQTNSLKWLAAQKLIPAADAAPATVKAEQQRVLFEENFSGKLADGWTWLNEDAECWRLQSDKLQIQAKGGSSWQKSHDGKNYLLRALPESKQGDLVVEVYVENDPKLPFEHAGLWWYYDDDNYVTLNKEFFLKQPVMLFVVEQDGAGKPPYGDIPYSANGVWLRLRISGNRITAQYRQNESEPWLTAGERDLPVKGEPSIGLHVGYGPKEEERWASFSKFRILEVTK